MPSFQGNPFKNFFKRILQVNNSSNTGVDATTRNIQTGDGASSAVSFSDDVLSVQPQNDDTTGTFLVKNNAGNNILTVDTSGTGTSSTATGRVLLGRSQVNALTQYAYFGIDSGHSTGYVADTHYAVPFGVLGQSSELAAMGTSTSSSFNDTDPATSLTLTTNSYMYVPMMWWVPDDITIDGVTWWHGADEDTGEQVVAHLMSYDVVADNSSTSGDLSNGTKLAEGNTVTNAGQEQNYFERLTINSADVDAGKVILFTFAASDNNSDYSINATIKYHIR